MTSEKMKLSAQAFSRAIDWVVKLTDKNDPNAFVYLEAKAEGEATLAVINQFSFMKSPVNVVEAPSEDLSYAISAKFLSKLSGPISRSTSDIILTKAEKNGVDILTIKTSSGTFNTSLIDGRLVKEPETTEVGAVKEADFFDAINRIAKICDTSHQMPAVTSVDLRVSEEDGKLSLMGTDTYALGFSSMIFSGSNNMPERFKTKSVLIPAPRASFVSADKKSLDDVLVVFDEASGKIGYRFFDGRVAMFSPNAGDSIDYSNMKKRIMETIKLDFEVDMSELKIAITTILDLAWNESASHWVIGKDNLVVKDSLGENKVSVPISNVSNFPEGKEEFEISFQRDVIQSSFHPITTEKAKISLSDEVAVLEQVGSDGSVLDNVFSYARAEERIEDEEPVDESLEISEI